MAIANATGRRGSTEAIGMLASQPGVKTIERIIAPPHHPVTPVKRHHANGIQGDSDSSHTGPSLIGCCSTLSLLVLVMMLRWHVAKQLGGWWGAGLRLEAYYSGAAQHTSW